MNQSYSQDWTPLHDQLHQTLRQRKLLPKNQRILIAVSGGQDSLCLTKLLLDLQSKWNWYLAIAHCDHKWRPDSEANANYVKKLAINWQLPFYLETANKIYKSEAEARKWRYQTLNKIALESNFLYIVTGHTASDRAETLLYNLIRGSGTDGLQALTWQRPLTESFSPLLVRPLLEISRTQTGNFCQEQKIRIWEDSTNQDLHYARNRIRLELFPILRQFNPQAELALAQTAEILSAEVEYFDNETEKLLEKVTEVDINNFNISQLEEQPVRYIINRLVLREAPLALQRRVMRNILHKLLPTNPNFSHIEKLTALINSPNRSQTDPFPGGAIAKVQHPWIILVSRVC
ncbi:tRNA lysidine(34) synthetase TilS [Okeania sp.]|uniref:tRNA lysidine(34) synthetase TilS n=1 Tax=Okeania sp. TaxID=3100323 RepID=UPI002B4AECD8|nr:tRNA lysidine(34) synthetase TilS [Okeania sp.]MEB3340043.1 tRNA lysidine(34) synthetase TilS [Okeania sp.]